MSFDKSLFFKVNKSDLELIIKNVNKQRTSFMYCSKEQCKTSLGISSLFLTSENWRLASLFLFIFIRSAHVYSCYHYITTTCYLVIFSMVSNLFNFIYSMTDVDVRSFFPVSYQSAVLRQTLWLVINRPIINRCR
jgi:hypothetical protein